MTIQSTVRKAGPFLGNGVTNVFPFTFKCFNTTDIQVVKTTVAGADIVLVLNSDYSVALNADQNASPGGSIAYPLSGTLLQTGEKLTATGVLAELQGTHITNGGNFFANNIEDQMDYLTILVQQHAEKLARALLASATDAVPILTLGTAIQRALKYVTFDASGNLALAQTLPSGTLSRASIASLLFPQTTQEAGASVVPSDLGYSPFRGEDVKRVGVVGNGVADDRAALNTANSIGAALYFQAGTYLINSNITFTVPLILDYGAKLKPANGVTVTVNNDVVAGTWKVFDLSAGGSVTGLKRSTPHWFGAVADGTTDDSTAIQQTVDSTKGGDITLLHGFTYLMAGLLLSGSTYNNTKIVVEGALKLKASGGGSNFGGAWVGIILQSCDNVTLDVLAFDGNRANQPQNEHIYCVGIAGASNYRLPRLYAREIRGDGLYIGQSTWGSSSTNPTDGRIGEVHVVNSADDGRNAVSVISAVGLIIDSVYSMKVGGTVNSVLEPGGLDFEPDAGYETISGVVVGSVNVTTAGTAGCQIFGRSISGVDANKDWNIFDITIGSVNLQKTGTSGGGLNGCNIFRCKDVRIDGSMYFATAVYGSGWVVDFADRIYGKLKARTVSNGVTVGFTGSVNDFAIEVHVTDYSVAGLKTTLVTNGRFTGRVYGAKAASTSYAIQCHNNARGTITQTDVIYAVDAPYDSVNVRAFRNEPANLVTFGAGTVCRDCDWTGYASYTVCFDSSIPKINIEGVNYGTAQPANGAWQQGDVVINSTPALAAGKVTTAWTRLTTGTANVTNTDWAAQVVPNA